MYGMMSKIVLFCVILLQIFSKIPHVKSTKLNVYYLESGDIKDFFPEKLGMGFYSADFQIYCYNGTAKSVWKYFLTANFQLDIENDEYTKYEGSTPQIVKSHYDENKSIFSFNFLTFKKTRTILNPFNKTCIGIDTLQPYKIRLNVIRADIWKISYFVVGLLIFTFAASLSKNYVFFYLSGISLGICASFLILVFLAGKLFPRRPVMYGVLIGGWTIGYYIIKMLMDNLQLILISYYAYVMWYILITGFISFIVCYRMGPPTNKRSKNIIKWILQFAALILVYISSEIQDYSIITIVLIIFQHYFPWKYFRNKINRLLYRWFPPKKRFLTMDEYNEQGVRETKSALEELKKYCNSPECKQWKMMTCLKNPKRFASFVEGENHLMDEEIFDHEQSKLDYTDSDLSDDDDDEINEKISTNVIAVPNKLQYRQSSYLNGSRTYEQQDMTRNMRNNYEIPITNRKVLYRSYEQDYSDDDDNIN